MALDVLIDLHLTVQKHCPTKIRMREIIYLIDGGIGHALNSTLALSISKRKCGSSAIILASWPDVFLHNPDVKQIYNIMKQPAEIAELLINVGQNYFMHKDNIYSDRRHLAEKNTPLRHLICKAYELRLPYREEDRLYFYPTETEIKDARRLYDELVDYYCTTQAIPRKDIRFAVIQPEGSGIGSNPAAALKAIPVRTTKEIIAKSPENVIWLHLKTKGENPIEHERIYPLTLPVRQFVTFLRHVDFGIGCESVANHIVAGLYRKPFICLMGRSNARTYMHDSTIVISEPGSCATFACEMPFYTVERICDRVKCMDAIDPQKVLAALDRVISQLP